MTNDIDAIFITLGDNGQLGIVFNAVAGVYKPAIHPSCKSGFGEAGTNIGGDIMNGGGLGKTAATAIGQGYDGHGKLLLVTQR